MKELLTSMAGNAAIKLVILAVIMDTFFGVGRAIKQRKFNSSVGIDGAIRKIAMITSLVFLAVIDEVVGWNMIGFLPETTRSYLPESMTAIGIAEFFSILYMAYEIVSILKNMVLCGLPVKNVWKIVKKFLGKYTSELPDDEELEEQEA